MKRAIAADDERRALNLGRLAHVALCLTAHYIAAHKFAFASSDGDAALTLPVLARSDAALGGALVDCHCCFRGCWCTALKGWDLGAPEHERANASMADEQTSFTSQLDSQIRAKPQASETSGAPPTTVGG